MTANVRNLACILVTILVVLSQFLYPAHARADETPPPPLGPTTETVPTESPVEDMTLPVIADSPTPEIPAVDQTASDSPLPAPAKTATTTPGQSPATTNSDDIQQTSLLDTLQDLPAETNIVVLDENSQPLPLASQEASNIIAPGDPVWCPAGQAPTPGANGCSHSYSYLMELVTYFTPTNNGTIWIEAGSYGIWDPCYPHTPCGGDTTIDGGVSGNWSSASRYTLTLQGGWSGISNDTSIVGESIFTTDHVSILSWGNDVTINNITFNSGLTVSTTQNVVINNSTFSNSGGIGAEISANDITVNHSKFSGNSIGFMGTADTVTLNCVTYQNNGIDESLNANVVRNPCQFAGPVEETPPPKPPVFVVMIPPGQKSIELPIECSQAGMFLIKWMSSGDWILLSCVDGGTVQITIVDNTDFSNDLPSGFEYVAGYNIMILKNGTPLFTLPDGKLIQPSFITRSANPNYSVMFWDEQGSQWILLDQFQRDVEGKPMSFSLITPQDERTILSGTYLTTSEKPNHEEVTINFPGIFVLVQQ